MRIPGIVACLGAFTAAGVAVVGATGLPRCRCEPRDLAEYFAAADEVALARLVSVETSDEHHRFQLVLESRPWKTSRPAEERVVQGDTVEYRTPISTATCGVPPRAEAVYILFGSRGTTDGVFEIDTCTGTRVYRPAPTGDALAAPPAGFRDVPGRFVMRQLDALGGLEALRPLGDLPDPAEPDRAVIRGLLDLEPLAHGGTVRVFERPDPEAPVLATVDAYEAVDTREVGYEVAAAVVYGRVDGWSRVGLTGGGAGWVAPDEAGTWFPYGELPVRRLAYLTSAWSGYIWPDLGAGIPTRVRSGTRARAEWPVEVTESRLLVGIPWFRVAVLDRSPCEGPAESSPTVGGWVPGYGLASDGPELQPTVWYWSRGC